MNATQHRLVDDYLHSLDEAAKLLPRHDRDELVDQIRAHLDEAIGEDATEADVRNVLDALGDPRDIVAAAGPVRAPVRRGAREVFALLLLATGFPPAIGWIAGLILLIASPLWSVRQKWLGALVWPGGWFGAFLLFTIPATSSGHVCTSNGPILEPSPAVHTVTFACSSGASIPGWVALVLLVIAFCAPIAVAMYLWRAAGRRSAE